MFYAANIIIFYNNFSCEDIMIWCRIGYLDYSPTDCCQVVIPVPTSSGKCFMYFSRAEDLQNIYGEYLGISLYINASAVDQPGN